MTQGLISFGFGNNNNNNEAELKLIRKDLVNFSHYAMSEFATKSNAIKTLSDQNAQTVARINGIEQTPFVKVAVTEAKNVTAPYTPIFGGTTYEEHNQGRVTVSNREIVLNPGIYMIFYNMYATNSTYTLFDATTEQELAGSTLSVSNTKVGAGVMIILHVPENIGKLRVSMRMTSGKRVNIVAPSAINISGINVAI